MGRLTTLETRHGTARLPAFFPDGTRAVIRTLDAQDLEACGVQGLIVNSFHLAYAPGVGLIKSQGGVHPFMGWSRPIISDSGGFQAMSMIRENARYGRISDRGITFTNVDVQGGKKLKLTPEKCIQMQFDWGTDIMMCLDDCPSPIWIKLPRRCGGRCRGLGAAKTNSSAHARDGIPVGGAPCSLASSREAMTSACAGSVRRP